MFFLQRVKHFQLFNLHTFRSNFKSLHFLFHYFLLYLIFLIRFKTAWKKNHFVSQICSQRQTHWNKTRMNKKNSSNRANNSNNSNNNNNKYFNINNNNNSNKKNDSTQTNRINNNNNLNRSQNKNQRQANIKQTNDTVQFELNV